MPTARSWTDVYRARTAYLDPAAIARYEDSRFRGPLGAYKLRRERRVVRSALAALPPNLRAVDCPTGVGRWISTLADRGHQVIGVDISVAMLTEARRRAEGVAAVHAEAEHLPFGTTASTSCSPSHWPSTSPVRCCSACSMNSCGWLGSGSSAP